ncbi:MAG TPA: hypothetical protein DEP45_11175, partial [Armatimonadetes bacterium]|nr:hypothetical protein [Armatimonadota bacterium]
GLAVVYLVLSATGLGDLSGDADVDADVDADLDHDLDVGMEHDVEAAMDHDVDTDLDHDVTVEHDVEGDVHAEVHAVHHLGAEHEVHEIAHDHEPSMLIRALSVLGFGKVPVSVLMTTMMVIFGATGLIANSIFAGMLPWSWAPTVYVWPSLALAVLASLGLTGSVAKGLSRLMPTKETYAVTEEELVGQVGVSIYGLPGDARGPVNVKDTGGTLHQVMGRSMNGAVRKGTEVLLVRYHRKEDYYDVAASPLTAIAEGAQENLPQSAGEQQSEAAGRPAAEAREKTRQRERTSSTQS